MIRGVVRFFLARRTIVVVVGLASVVSAGLLLGGSVATRISITALLTSAYLSLVLLVAKEVVRQDRHWGAVRNSNRRAIRSPGGEDVTPRASAEEVAAETPGRKRFRPEPTAGSLVSVVVTAHNEQQLVAAALESVQQQSWQNLECIVVDDASTDSSLAVAIGAVGSDERFVFLHCDQNKGLSGARNAGLQHASGAYVTFLDGDDLLYPDALEKRLAALLSTDDPEWVVGTYMLWHSIGEEDPLPTSAPTIRSRGRVSWLDTVHDAPFIASAPLLRTDVLRAVGGFDEGLGTAEDYDLWSRLLRHGYVLDVVNDVGIAYRQKRNSLYRRSVGLHAALSDRIYRAALEPADVSGGPHPLTEPYYVYESARASLRRTVTALVGAIGANIKDEQSTLLEAVRSTPSLPFLLRVTDIQAVVRSAAVRLERWSDEALSTRVAELERHVWAELAPTLGMSERDRRPASVRRAPGLLSPPAREAPNVRRLRHPLGASPVEGAPPARRLLLMPESAYHVDELGPLAELAAAEGCPPAFLVSDYRLDAVAAELLKYDVPVYTYRKDAPPGDAVVDRAAAIVTMNDWGAAKDLVLACNEAGIPTFGKVEGVQDFHDDDVHWERGAYTRVATVLCQGPNDEKATTGDRQVVGSTRLERIWSSPESMPTRPLAVINVNFTYGVLAEARDGWVESSIAACRRVGLPFVLSAHPAERRGLPQQHVAQEPMRHLLTHASVLISRFSTVPFEAMARGVPFVYFNPHGERVPTFREPGGAFPVATDMQSLAQALQEVQAWRPGYRERAADFFLAQVDVQERPSELRTWDVLKNQMLAVAR